MGWVVKFDIAIYISAKFPQEIKGGGGI